MRFLRKLRLPSKLSIAWACGLCFFSAISPASADWSESQIAWLKNWLRDWYDNQTEWQSELTSGSGWGGGDNGALGAILWALNHQQSFDELTFQALTGLPPNQTSRIDRVYNVLGYLDTITNQLERLTVGGADTNAWWYTNSTFTLLNPYNARPLAPNRTTLATHDMTFPQFMAWWSAELTSSRNHSVVQRNQWWKYWGTSYTGGGLVPNSNVKNPDNYYTWFDYVTDMLRTNWIMNTTIGLIDTTNRIGLEAEQTGAAAYVDNGENVATNTIVENEDFQPDYQHDWEPPSGTFSSYDTLLDDLSDVQVDTPFPSLTGGGNPYITLFPGGSYGSVNVPRVEVSLAANPSVEGAMQIVFSWLWKILAFASCFYILRQEIGFWSTLGGSASDS